MEKCGWRRVIVYYAWGSFCSVAVNLTIPSSPLIGIPVFFGRGPWRAYTGARRRNHPSRVKPSALHSSLPTP